MWRQPFTSEVTIGYIAFLQSRTCFSRIDVTMIRSIARQTKWHQY